MLRRMSVVLAVLMLAPALSFGGGPVRFGVSLSGVFSDLHTGAEIDFFQQYSGLGAGVFSEIEMMSWVSLGVGAELLQGGFTEEYGEDIPGDDHTNIVEATTRLNYFSVPLYVKFNLVDNKFVPYVLGGVRMNWLMSHKAGVAEYENFDDQVSPYASLMKDSHKSWILGIGISTPVADVFRLDIQLSHSRDTEDVMKSGNSDVGNGRNYITALTLRFAR